MQITKLSITRPSLIIVIFTVLTLAGLGGARLLRYELLPKFSPPRITISAVYPGASPIEVENAVTKPLEDIASGVENIKNIESSSFENFSLIRIEADADADVDEIVNIIQKKVTARLADFPDEMQPPNVGKFDFDDLPIIKLGLYADLPPAEFFDLVKTNIIPTLARLDGVAQIRLLGGQEREIKVNLFRQKMEEYRVSIAQVLEAIGRANVEVPAGKLQDDKGQVLVRLSGKVTSLDDLRAVKVSTMPDGTELFLGDVAEVIDGVKAPEILARANGQDAIGIYLQKQSDANAVEVSALVKEAIVRMEKDFSNQNLNIETLQDTSEFTLEAAKGVFQDLLLAIILVAMVMFIFLQSIRNSLIIMFVVPLSLVATLGVMYLLGFTFNLMSLLGLTLAVGTLVDDAIVVIENIYRHLEMGKSRVQAAYDGTKELGLTLVATTLTLVVVFVPITFAGGLVSDLLTQFAMTVAVSVLFSTLVAFTVVPLLASRFARIEDFKDNPMLKWLTKVFNQLVNFLAKEVAALLQVALSFRWVTLLIALLLFAGTVALIPAGYLSVDFLEAGDRGEFLVQIELPKDATLRQTNQLAHQAELILKERPEITSIFTTVGTSAASAQGRNTPYLAELNVKLIDKNLREFSTPIIARQVKVTMESQMIGAKIKPVSINILGLADRAPVDVKIIGPDKEAIADFSEQVYDEIDQVSGVVELETPLQGGSPEIVINLNRQRLEALGLSIGQVGYLLRTALTGNTDFKFSDQGKDYDINIRLDAYDRKNLEDLLSLGFLNAKGQRIYLYQFAQLEESVSPTVLERFSRSPAIAVKGQIVGRPFGDANDEIVERVSQLELPPSTEVQYEGSQKQQIEGFGALIFAGIASILLLYFTMVVLYDSFAYPFVVLFTIPLAVIGAFLALGLSMEVISLFSITGLLMLVGLVAKNAILVVDFTVHLRNEGVELRKALIRATGLRFRPVLMTNISMIIGLIPIAIATGAGAEWKNGLGWALIGGLTSSMFLSLIVVPVVYFMVEKFLQLVGWDKKKEIVIED